MGDDRPGTHHRNIPHHAGCIRILGISRDDASTFSVYVGWDYFDGNFDEFGIRMTGVSECHTLIVGLRGCGKMETMRRNSGLTQEEFQEQIEATNQLLEEAKKRREDQVKLDRLVWLLHGDDF